MPQNDLTVTLRAFAHMVSMAKAQVKIICHLKSYTCYKPTIVGQFSYNARGVIANAALLPNWIHC